MEEKTRDYSVIGKPLPRVDGKVKVTGTAVYADDLSAPGMLFGKLVRSPYAHARIVQIDTAKAERLPGVRAVLTGKDFPGTRVGFGGSFSDRPPIALEKVRHYGEAVAALAAVDEDTAEEALDLVEVTYEELPPVLNWEEAMREGAPLVHDSAARNIGFRADIEYGDPEKALREAEHVREEHFVTQKVSVGFIEPHAALAQVDASGKVLFQGSKQSPYITWRQLCYGLGLPLEKVRIVNPYVGGAMSGKHEALDLDFCAVRLAQKTRRPVKIVVGQDEVLSAYRQRHRKDIWIKMGMKKDGTLLAADCRLIADGGAYLSVGPLVAHRFGMFLGMPYRLPNLRYHADRIYTNLPVCGAVRGMSQAISSYVVGSMLNLMACDLNLDPADVMIRNLLKSGEKLHNGVTITSIGLEQAIRSVTEAMQWKQKRAERKPYRGYGLACGTQSSGTRQGGGHYASAAMIKVTEDGSVNLIHGGTELGQGCDTVLSQIAAEVLGLRLEDIHVAMEDSQDTVFDPGMFGDRCTVWSGQAVKAAAEDARAKLAKSAAEMLGVPEQDVVFRDRKVYPKDNPGKALPFIRVVRNAQYGMGQPIYGTGTWFPPGIKPVDFAKAYAEYLTPSFSYMAQGLEVEVDPETGKIRVLTSVSAEDCGQPINPLLVEGQNEGGVVHMLGQALYEECRFDERGKPLCGSFRDYKIPTSVDMPRFVNMHIITNDALGPFGAKGAGETSNLTSLAALSNAVHDAAGILIRDLPITPPKVLKALAKKRREIGHEI